MSLIEGMDPTAAGQPLASRMRPRDLSEFVGQEHLVGEGKLLRQMIERDQIPSMILWGPPGVGKTTLANVVANATKAEFVTYSAVTSGIKEIKEIMARAEQGRLLGLRTVLFVDEIHRFNKAQQDAFLPFVEQGSIILIGATTENPSFEVNSALLSRCKVFVLKGLTEENLVALLRHALDEDRGFGKLGVVCSDDMLRKIAIFANGDARNALGTLETAVANSTINQDGKPEITEDVQERRGALQHYLGAPQVDAQLRSGCGGLLACTDAGRRGGSALHRASVRPLRVRRRGARGSERAPPGERRVGFLP